MIKATSRGTGRSLLAAIAPFFACVLSLASSASPLSAQAAADLLSDEVSRGDTYAVTFDLSNVELGKKARLTLKLPNSLILEKRGGSGRYRCKLQNPAGARNSFTSSPSSSRSLPS